MKKTLRAGSKFFEGRQIPENANVVEYLGRKCYLSAIGHYTIIVKNIFGGFKEFPLSEKKHFV